MNFQLQATHAGAHIDLVVHQATFVEIGGIAFFHANGRTTTTDIAGQRKQLFHVNQTATFVAACFGGFFKIYLFRTGNNAHKQAGLVASQH